MSPLRPKTVDEILHAVSKISGEARASFLNESCGDDQELRSEVEARLSVENTFDSLIDSSGESPADQHSSEPNTSRIGTQINQYKVLSLLGKGGMGVVYLAWDSKLERNVAIKLLSNKFAADEKRLSRFFQEAKAASALNHPNILTIHEIGEVEGMHYIVTEFIEGKTLKRYLSHEKLSLRSTLDIATQILSALSAAHEAGITHRDIKPDNVMVRKDGIVKVLDFGLAKLSDSQKSQEVDPEAATRMKAMTVPGMVIGTPQYMSPEQARGQKVDSRTDIFSFGILLYEMISGSPPFSGVNELDTIGSILRDEPSPLSERAPQIPLELDRLVGKTLRKDREERYQHIKDLYIDLNDVKKTIETDVNLSRSTASGVRANTLQTTSRIATERRFSLIHLVGALLIFVGAAGAVWWIFGPSGDLGFAVSQLKTSEIISWASKPGEMSSEGTFSPDGKMIAFASSKADTKNIWIKQTVSGEAVQITKEESRDDQPIWSPSGDELAYFSNRGNQGGIWRIPILGGSPKLIAPLDDGSSKLLRWSKSDIIVYESKHDVFALEVSSGESKQITDLGEVKVLPRSTNISPDEKHISYVVAEGDAFELWELNVDSRAMKKLVTSTSEIKHTVWHPDNQRIFYDSSVNGTFQLLVTDIHGAQPKQISSNERDGFVLDVSGDGSKILFGSAKEESDIWGVNLKDNKEYVVGADIDAELWPDVSPDGKTILYQSVKNLSQGNNLDMGRLVSRKLDSDEQPIELAEKGKLPVWSPNGEMIAFQKFSGDRDRIYTIKVGSGAQPREVSDNVDSLSFSVFPYNRTQSSFFHWSPDSLRIAYVSGKDGAPNIWLVGADGSGDSKLTDNRDENVSLACPIWNSDGRRIAFASRTNNSNGKTNYGLWVIDSETKVSQRFFDEDKNIRLIGWSQTGDELISASTTGDVYSASVMDVSLLRVNVKTGITRLISELKDAYLFNIHLSSDGKNIAFAAHRETIDNIWLVPVAGGEAKRLTNNNDSRMYFSSLDWSPDGNVVFFGKQLRYSILSMLTNFK